MPVNVVGVDVGTSSTKGVLVSLEGEILATAVRQHQVSAPAPGQFEMDPKIWWHEFCDIVGELLVTGNQPAGTVAAVGVSGMGPCVGLADALGNPVRPAILYGVDTRSTAEVAEWTQRLGADAIMARGGSLLTSQAAGPKIAWVANHEPEVYARARQLYMPASWLVKELTGAYVLDHHSASQCSPLYDEGTLDWYWPWCEQVAPGIELPALRWPGEVAGEINQAGAQACGLPVGTPVITGTIDAWTEAISADAVNPGDLMLMYGTTMFLVNTLSQPGRNPAMWGTVGAMPGTWSLAGGMATSGAITQWLVDLFGNPGFPEMIAEADASGIGANGLLMLPYFAGERTPIFDPMARGVIAGLTVSHQRGDLYRCALEATGFGVRHNIETMGAAGGQVDRIIAVGGGTKGDLWTRIVSDITDRPQVIPTHTIGASFGAALLAAGTQEPVKARDWNPPARITQPDPEAHQRYEQLYQLYRQLYPATVDIAHALADLQTQ